MRFLFTVLITLITLSCFSQYLEKEEGLVSRRKPGVGYFYSGTKPYDTTRLRKYDRLVIDVVYNDWYGDRDYLESPITSIGFNINGMFDKPLTKANTVALGYGLALSHYNNLTEKSFERNFENQSTSLSDFDTISNIVRSKYVSNYLEIPLELRFRTKGQKHFKFFVGGKIGWQVNAYTKTTEEINGSTYRFKSYNFPDNNRLRYGATVRVGIRNWSLYGAYFFSELFSNNKSVSLTPVTFGLSIALF